MWGRKKDKKIEKSDFFKKIIKKYKVFCYRTFGSQFKGKDKYQSLDDQLRMADMDYTADIFLSTMLFTGIIVTTISFFVYLLFFNFIFSSESWFLYVIILTLINSSFSFGMFFILLKMKISNRKMQIDQEIPFTLSELSVLASTGLTPIKIVRHIAKRKDANKTMTNEFKKIVHKIDVEGKDIVTAMSETATETTSQQFREGLWDKTNMIHQGGDLDEYLRQKADQTMQLRRDVQKTFTEKIASYSEMYVSLVLVGVLFLGIAAFLMNVMSITMGPIDAEGLLLLLAYGLIPIAAFIVNVIISTAYSRGG